MKENNTLVVNEVICQEEKNANLLYVIALCAMEAISAYFMLSLVVSFLRSPRTIPHPENQSCCKLQYTSILRSLLITVIVAITTRLALDITQLCLGEAGYPLFGPIFISKAVLSTITMACVYAFLWLRQWLLYNQPVLRDVKTVCFKICNLGTLVLVTSLVAVGPALELRYVKLELSEDGCIRARAGDWGAGMGIYTAFAIIYEMILLGFFIYPMKRVRSIRGLEANRSVLPIVKRSLISAIICFTNEILFIIIHNVVVRPIMLNSVTTDLKYIVYYICLVSSYNDWMQKFCLPCTVKVTPIHTGSKETGTKFSTDDELDTHEGGV